MDRYILYKKNNCVKASLLEYTVKISTNEEKEEASSDCLTQILKIRRDIKALISVKTDLLEEIYASVHPPEKVVSVIPYGMALTAILREKGVSLDKTLVFIDYQDADVFLTLIDRDIFSTPRVIINTSKEYVLREVEKTVKHYLQLHKHLIESDIRILSNEEIGIQKPAVAGMEISTADVNFELPSRIIAKKKQSYLLSRWIKVGISLILLTSSICLYLFLLNAVNNYKQLNINLVKQHQEKVNILEILSSLKVYSQINAEPQINFTKTYSFIMKKAPRGTRLSNLSLEKITDQHAWVGKVNYQLDNNTALKKLSVLNLGLLNESIKFISDDDLKYVEVVFNLELDGVSYE